MQVGVSKAWVFPLEPYNIFWDDVFHPMFWWIVTVAAQKRCNKDASFLDNHHVGVEPAMLLISDAHRDINSLLTLKVMGLFEFLKYRKHLGHVFSARMFYSGAETGNWKKDTNTDLGLISKVCWTDSALPSPAQSFSLSFQTENSWKWGACSS
mgnify:CR=1 FL=1